jgi:hypothetical protein
LYPFINGLVALRHFLIGSVANVIRSVRRDGGAIFLT